MRSKVFDPNANPLLRPVDSANCHHAHDGIMKSSFDVIDSTRTGDGYSSLFNHNYFLLLRIEDIFRLLRSLSNLAHLSFASASSA